MKKIFLFAFSIATAFSSCDKIKFPYAAKSNSTSDTSSAKVRKVFIEDYTGQKCVNCPTAATTILAIKGIHPKNIVSVAVHCDFYSIPAAAPYTYDFRTTPGNDYDTYFQPPNFPIGMINRKDYPSNQNWKSVSNWSAIVDSLLAKAPDATLTISNNYNSTSRVLNTSVKTQFLTPHTSTYKLMVLLTEDSIVSPQKCPPNIDSLTYVHHHVLRSAISSTSWGDVLTIAGDTSVKAFQYTLPATFNGMAPKENYCYVVAYIYDATTYEILQAEEKKIK
ncbi:MAG TPA: Omp28 family outer membrane lipoprotein [Bacteroidia bacterium]